MPDYQKLIDAETWAFIERTNSFYPPDAVDLTIEQQRRVYDRMCAAFHAGRPETVSVRDAAIAANGHSVPVRIYDHRDFGEPAAIVVYCHGGGFVVGGLDSHDDVCAELCEGTGYRVVSVDYRLSPEHLHPAAFEDALAGFRWAAAEFEGPVVMAGDSAGGNLAAAVCHAARSDRRPPAGQVLIYPGLGGDQTRGSYVEHAEAPMLTRRDVEFYEGVRFDGPAPSGDPSVAPLDDTDFAGIAPAAIFSAECDPLCDDGRAYRDAILAAGGQAVWYEERGFVHGYLRARHSSARARASFARIVAAVRALGARRADRLPSPIRPGNSRDTP